MLLSLLRHFQFKASSFCNNGQRWPTPMFLSCYFRCCILYVVPAVLRAEKSNNTSAEMSASLSDTSNRYVHCVYEVMLDNTKYVSYIDINGGYHRSRLFWLLLGWIASHNPENCVWLTLDIYVNCGNERNCGKDENNDKAFNWLE